MTGCGPRAEAPSTTYDGSLPAEGAELSGLDLWVAVRQALDRGNGVLAREYATRMGERPGAAMQALAIQVAQNDPFLEDQQRQTRVLSLVRSLRARDPLMWNAALQDARQASGEGRDQEALALARQMHTQWPTLAPVTLFLVELLVARGWDGEADGLIAEATAAIPGACTPLYSTLSGAQRRGVAARSTRPWRPSWPATPRPAHATSAAWRSATGTGRGPRSTASPRSSRRRRARSCWAGTSRWRARSATTGA
jgi:hypothetical protein